VLLSVEMRMASLPVIPAEAAAAWEAMAALPSLLAAQEEAPTGV
jgi:hypothetical protein